MPAFACCPADREDLIEQELLGATQPLRTHPIFAEPRHRSRCRHLQHHPSVLLRDLCRVLHLSCLVLWPYTQ